MLRRSLGLTYKILQIHRIIRSQTEFPQIIRWNLDFPELGSSHEFYTLDFAGWALGKDVPIRRAVLRFEDTSEITLDSISRKDVGKHFPSVPWASDSGYQRTISLLGLPLEFKIMLEVYFEGSKSFPLATIEGVRKPLSVPPSETFNPLMVTSLGRTGTSWLMHLLAQHPQIIVFDRYPFELRAASYTAHMLKILTSPANHTTSSHPDRFIHDDHFIGHNPFFTAQLKERDALGRWFGKGNFEHLAQFCQDNINNFYDQVARSQGVSEVSYFAEKLPPLHTARILHELFPGAQEIFLVRDFRDMLASIFAFDEKRGVQSFGREMVNSDAEYIKLLKKHLSLFLSSWNERKSNSLLLHYESLVEKPETSLTRILKHLNLDYSQVIVQNMLEHASQLIPEMNEHRTTSSPKNSIGRWIDDLSDYWKTVCREEFSEFLEEFGYHL